jgi:two-component system sensor histidine kinase/response regulator
LEPVNKKNKILIVDDTADVADLLRKRFRAEGYDTSIASDGEECLQKVEAYNPDLVVLDVMMPKLDGFQVLERLRMDEKTKYIPVLMLTAKSKMPEKIKGLQRGADDYLTKPFDFKELSTRVKSLLAKEEASKKIVEEEKSEALGQMVDEVAHEVRNPLTVIGGLARRIHKNLPEGSRDWEYMEIILQNVATLERMVKELFELKGAALCYIERSDLNEIVIRALKNNEDRLTANNIEVRTRLIAPPPLIPMDKENITRAFGYLIENAIEAMTGERRVLTISCQQSKGQVELVFADTGKGISRQVLKKIFDPFYTSKTYGPGLGLSFVLKTIQSHKGIISVESEEGKGTSFTIKLPTKRGAGVK